MTIYVHYKNGDPYELLYTATHTEDEEEYAVYRAVSRKHSKIWIRPMKMFNEPILWPDGVERPRFTLLKTMINEPYYWDVFTKRAIAEIEELLK